MLNVEQIDEEFHFRRDKNYYFEGNCEISGVDRAIKMEQGKRATELISQGGGQFLHYSFRCVIAKRTGMAGYRGIPPSCVFPVAVQLSIPTALIPTAFPVDG